MRSTFALRPYALALLGLTLLFGVRILAQPLSRIVPTLPGFDAWHGGVLPYPVLLLSQLLILAAMVIENLQLARGALVQRPRLGRWLALLGSLYFAGMVLRLVLGQTLYAGSSWFDRPLPTLFHLVLAAWLLLLARYHIRHGR
ncbi:MAG: hypothetical protein Q7J36_17420 [Thiobacillus sp.]|nr:hypothetical protein [Thiobacillus sp.]